MPATRAIATDALIFYGLGGLTHHELFKDENLAPRCLLCTRSANQRPEVDTAMSIIFGRAAPNDYACVRTGLESYMENIRSSTGGKYISPYDDRA